MKELADVLSGLGSALIMLGARFERCHEECPISKNGEGCTFYKIAKATGVDPLQLTNGEFYKKSHKNFFIIKI